MASKLKTCVVCGRSSSRRICELCGHPDQIRMVCATCGQVQIWDQAAVELLKQYCREAGYEINIPDRVGITIRFNACCVLRKPLRLTIFDVSRLFN